MKEIIIIIIIIIIITKHNNVIGNVQSFRSKTCKRGLYLIKVPTSMVIKFVNI